MQDLSRYKKKENIEIQSKYVSLLVGGSIALIGLVFALGLLVGSRGGKARDGSCPPADPLEALDARSGEPKPPAGPPDGDFKTFHETLTQPAETAVTPASLLPTGPEDAAAKLAAAAAPLPDADLVRPRHAEAPMPEEVRDSEPGTYSLQVDSFRDRREAALLVQKLARAGHQAFLVSVDNPDRGGQWFRVRIGPFSTKAEAWKYKRAFEEKERMATFVVKRKNGDG